MRVDAGHRGRSAEVRVQARDCRLGFAAGQLQGENPGPRGCGGPPRCMHGSVLARWRDGGHCSCC